MLCAAGDEGKAQHQQSIAQDRADQRCLHQSDEAGLQREDADEEFRQVTNGRLDYAGRRWTKVIAELVGSLADHVGHTRERECTQQMKVKVGPACTTCSRAARPTNPATPPMTVISLGKCCPLRTAVQSCPATDDAIRSLVLGRVLCERLVSQFARRWR